MTKPGGGGKLIECLCELHCGGAGQMPSPNAPMSLETLALAKNGSQKRVRDTGELIKMVDSNAL